LTKKFEADEDYSNCYLVSTFIEESFVSYVGVHNQSNYPLSKSLTFKTEGLELLNPHDNIKEGGEMRQRVDMNVASMSYGIIIFL
jgi:hypothetical protein